MIRIRVKVRFRIGVLCGVYNKTLYNSMHICTVYIILAISDTSPGIKDFYLRFCCMNFFI